MDKTAFFNKMKKQKLSKQIFIALFVILFISVLIIGSATYRLLATAYSRQIAYSQERTLQQTERTTNSIIRGVEQSVVAFSINQDTNIMVNELRKNNFTDVDIMITSLRELKNTNKAIDSIYIYLGKEKTVLSSNNGIWRLIDFYDNQWAKELPLSQNSGWIDTRTFIDNTGEKTQVLSYITLLANDIYNEEDFLIVNLSVEELSRNIETNNPIDDEYTILTNSDGIILVSNNQEWNGRKISFFESNIKETYFETMIQSFYNGWVYINYIPTSHIEQKVGSIAISVSLVLFAWLVFGMIIAKILTTKISNPYSSIVEELQKESALDDFNIISTSEADLFRLAFKKIMQQNQTMSEKIIQDEISSRDNVARFLLLENNLEQSNSYYSKIAIDTLENGPYYVILVSIDNTNKFFEETTLKDRSLWLFCIQNIVAERLGELGSYMSTLIGKGNFTFILSSSKDKFDIIDKCKSIHNEVGLYLPLSVTIAISDRFDNISNTSNAFSECLELVKHKMELGSSVIYEDIVERGNNNDIAKFISILKRDQLNIYISNGSLSQIENLIDSIVKTFSVKPNPMSETIFLIMSTILSDVISKTIENGWSLDDFFSEDRNLYQELIEQETIFDIGEWLKENIRVLSSALKSKKGAKNATIIESIVKYMNENYGEDIRLDKMAEKVYLSSPYLSRLFKQETGMNFSEKLTSIRIEVAKELLIGTNQKLQDIADKCNLGSTNNFIRIFKKLEGLTPGQFRSKFAKNNMKNKSKGK